MVVWCHEAIQNHLLEVLLLPLLAYCFQRDSTHAHMAVLNASDGDRNLQHMAAELYEVDVSLAPSIVKVPAVDCDQCTT